MPRSGLSTASVLTLAALSLSACGQPAETTADAAAKAGAQGARSSVWVAGSSTVSPFAARVSETAARKTGGAAAKVESLGTGGGIKLFCGGVGTAHPDIATASRPMKASEFETCAANGVTDIAEIKVGYDGIVIVTAKTGADLSLTIEQIYQALAAQTPAGQPNPAKTWKDVAPGLPATRIEVYGPPPTSGTRDAFVELAMQAGAEKNAQMKALKATNEDEFKTRAGTVRSDGGWIDSGENDNAIIGSLTKTPGAVGVLGYSFLDNNRDQIKAASVGGVAPSVAAIADGSYPLSRSLFLYVKKANLQLVPGLKDYVVEFVSDAAAGRGGYLQERGLIPLPEAEHATIKQQAVELPSMAKPAK